MDIMKYTLGDYYETASSTFLTKEQPSANIPRPELLNLIGKRLLVISEPENNTKLNANFIKYITGGD